MAHNKLSYNQCAMLPSQSCKITSSNPGYSNGRLSTSLQPSNQKNSNICSNDKAYTNRLKGNLSSNDLPKKRKKLSKREIECMQWASEGKTSFEIAKILGLSENTINNYIASVVRKIGASNRLHMVGIGLREKYID